MTTVGAPFWADDHPVLTVLRSRRASGSGPGARADGHRVAVAVEGGGMRGIISCAMLAALKDEGYLGAVDDVYGASSGSVNAAYFLVSDLAEALSIYYDDLASRNFVDWRRVVRGGAFFDVDYAFNEVFDSVKPLDYPAVLRSPVTLHVAVTLVDRCTTVVPTAFDGPPDLRSALRAGAWLPLATRGTAEFRGQRALDGGLLIAHPARIALDDGCTHVLSLSTKVLTGRSGRPNAMHLLVARRLNALRRGLGDCFLRSLVTDAVDKARWQAARTSPDGPGYVLDIGPLAGDALPTRHDTDTGRLLVAARLAYSRMLWALAGKPTRVIPRFAPSKGLGRAPDSSGGAV